MKKFSVAFCFTMIICAAFAQNDLQDNNTNNSIENRIRVAPSSVFSKFREAGMNPVNHELTDLEMKKVQQAIKELPSLHQEILRNHLHSISFMDNMPNTALTSPIDKDDDIGMYNIVFRAGILNETISEWATWKENTYFTSTGEDFNKVVIEAGQFDAFLYVLLHEATHVVDAVLDLTPHSVADGSIVSSNFTKDIWSAFNVPADSVLSPLLQTTRFRSGKPVDISFAKEVYQDLLETPFVSLYSLASWYEDIAELLTIYHLTNKMKQTYKITFYSSDGLQMEYEPIKNPIVQDRLTNLEIFYQE